jgi:hypothetical protein
MDAGTLWKSSGATLDVRNVCQETPLHVACEIWKFDGSTESSLIDHGSDIINSRDGNGLTALNKASRHRAGHARGQVHVGNRTGVGEKAVGERKAGSGRWARS